MKFFRGHALIGGGGHDLGNFPKFYHFFIVDTPYLKIDLSTKFYISSSLYFSFSLVSFVFVFLFLYTRAARQCIMPHHGVSPVHTQGANMAPQDGFNTSFLCVCGFSFAF